MASRSGLTGGASSQPQGGPNAARPLSQLGLGSILMTAEDLDDESLERENYSDLRIELSALGHNLTSVLMNPRETLIDTFLDEFEAGQSEPIVGLSSIHGGSSQGVMEDASQAMNSLAAMLTSDGGTDAEMQRLVRTTSCPLVVAVHFPRYVTSSSPFFPSHLPPSCLI
jgi:hypothetical protein